MKKEEIHLWDWHRILIGQAPWEFMIEVFVRTVQPGLSIIPEYDKEFIHMTQKKVENKYACSACGNIQNSSSTPKEKCEICNNKHWEEAYL